MAEKDEASAHLPETMYGWRVAAMRDWCGANAPVTMAKMATVGHLDQYHYRGLDANRDIARNLGGAEAATSEDAPPDLSGRAILDVGSGIGGSLRYLAWKCQCRVVGLEIQAELVDESNRLAELLSSDFAGGAADCQTLLLDASETEAFEKACAPASFDGWFSLLCLLHVPEEPRLRLLTNVFRTMKPGARFSIEDYVLMGDEPLQPQELHVLQEVVGACWIPTRAEYEGQMRRACADSHGGNGGPALQISEIVFHDMTVPWRAFTAEREAAFLAEKSAHLALHGAAHVAQMEAFYSTVAELFRGGRLGGAQIVGEVGYGKGSAPVR